MTEAIVIKNLRKEFGNKTAVRDISLTIQKGTLFSLLGVNGAGKTTTIRMLTGLSKPSGGEAYVMGRQISSQMNEVKRIVGISPQETSMAPNLTVKENLEFMAGIYGMDRKKSRIKAEEIITKFSFKEVESTKAKLLSGGWQRRLSIAMALISEPEVLFLDEPTLGLDVLARKELWRIITALKGRTTVVLTTHYMEEAEALSDALAVMVDGEIRAEGTVEELKQRTHAGSLEEAFVAIAEEGM